MTDGMLFKVEHFKRILVNRATGKSQLNDEEEYGSLRLAILRDSRLQPNLPDFIHTCRTLDDFWDHVKEKFPTYQERRSYLKDAFSNTLQFLETISADAGITGDLFESQFPAGLPFGTRKPSLAVLSHQGAQVVSFEDEPDIGVLRNNIYPNFTFEQLNSHLQGKPVIQQTDTAKALYQLSQTSSEKNFLISYAKKYNMRAEAVPVLIPQAWIQWHSKTKRELRANASLYIDDLYRVDFVAFWDNKRYVILIDDISHYARKKDSSWEASEENYSKRLKEDRKLRKEGWLVFRISNWELRDQNVTQEILDDLRNFIGF